MTEADMRPSKKQKELLEFVESFIAERGYGPSYREIMGGCNYSSVATVAVHINNLISKGYLRKRDNSARSLEVIGSSASAGGGYHESAQRHKEWLISRIEAKFAGADPGQTDEMETLVKALKLLGFDNEAQKFQNRLSELKQKHQ